jgi:hypothetical protein
MRSSIVSLLILFLSSFLLLSFISADAGDVNCGCGDRFCCFDQRGTPFDGYACCDGQGECNESSSSCKGGSLSSGAIAGIIIGSIFGGMGLIMALVFWLTTGCKCCCSFSSCRGCCDRSSRSTGRNPVFHENSDYNNQWENPSAVNNNNNSGKVLHNVAGSSHPVAAAVSNQPVYSANNNIELVVKQAAPVPEPAAADALNEAFPPAYNPDVDRPPSYAAGPTVAAAPDQWNDSAAAFMEWVLISKQAFSLEQAQQYSARLREKNIATIEALSALDAIDWAMLQLPLSHEMAIKKELENEIQRRKAGAY